MVTLSKRMLDKNKVYCKDVIKGLNKIEDNTVDIIIADPPYNIDKNFKKSDYNKKEIEDYVNWCQKWIDECSRVLKNTGSLFIYGFSEILSHISANINLKHRWLVWHYTNKTVPRLKFWQRSHESILCCWIDNPIFNRDKIRVPYTEAFKEGSAGKTRAETEGRYSSGEEKTKYKAHPEGALPRDVIKVPALAGGAGRKERVFYCKTCDKVYKPSKIDNHRKHEIEKHPTQKPLKLSARLIQSAKPNDDGLFLSPFAGTGSECVVAKHFEMNYIGIDNSSIYVRMAQKMLKKYKEWGLDERIKEK